MRLSRLLVLMSMASVLVLMSALAAQAVATYVVTTTADQAEEPFGAELSLREAIQEANGDADDSVIELASGETYLLVCDPSDGGDDSGDNWLDDLNHDPADDAALTINGNGATIRQTCPGYRVLRDRSSGHLTLNQVTLTGGTEDGSGGGVKTDGPALVSNSTISGNTAAGNGGGIYSFDSLTLSHATIIDNGAFPGGNLHAEELISFGSVIAAPSSGANCDILATSSSGYNHADDPSCGLSAPSDDEAGGDPLLAPLTDGVHVPLPASPLVDAIALADCSVFEDQPGTVRPQGAGCDIGAVEVAVPCPCFDDSGVPLICYDTHAPILNAFAWAPPTFRQVTNSWCRTNSLFQWVTPAEAAACDAMIHSLCGLP